MVRDQGKEEGRRDRCRADSSNSRVRHAPAEKIDLPSRTAPVSLPPPGDVVRSTQMEDAVERASQVAWLFVPPLERLGIARRVISAGLLTAVMPGRNVSARQISLPVGDRRRCEVHDSGWGACLLRNRPARSRRA
jgi:hypothetical protein